MSQGSDMDDDLMDAQDGLDDDASDSSDDSDDDLEDDSPDSSDDSDDDYVLIDGVLVKLRGDGSIDDDDYIIVNGVPLKLRGDGSIDDSQEICTDSDDYVTGSLLADLIRGLAGSDNLRGLLGSDDLFGDDGDDIIGAGGGRDFLDGGLGADLLIGGFGSNYYRDCADGFRDTLRIRSDHYLVNPLTGTAGNNADGQRTDLIEELDRRDRVVIEGVRTGRLRFKGVVESIQGESYSGIGIYAKGVLEAIYLGDDLNRRQLRDLTTGEIV